MPEVRISNATMVPSPEVIREFVKQLQELLKTDRSLAGAFALNPRGVLADRGLAFEFQEDMLREIQASGAGVQCTAVSGCACTGCCATSW